MRRILFALAIVLMTVTPTLGQDMSSIFSGWWVSSTGTIIQISPTGESTVVRMTIGSGPSQEAWLNSSRDGVEQITYKSSDGSTMLGKYFRGADIIEVTNTNDTSNFKATWSRRQ